MNNKGIGLIFETEGDTLAQTFKSEHGNYSDGFRKAFHHEIISYNRRKDREFVELETPRLSALLSGTPKQVSPLIPNAENGLFSRFIFYYMNIKPIWKDVFAGDDSQTLDDYFRHLGNQFFDFYKTLQQQSAPLRFCFTGTQQQTFNAHFSQAQNQYLYLCGLDYLATVRRLGLITFRIAMILTALRCYGHRTYSNTSNLRRYRFLHFARNGKNTNPTRRPNLRNTARRNRKKQTTQPKTTILRKTPTRIFSARLFENRPNSQHTQQNRRKTHCQICTKRINQPLCT